MVPPGTGLAGPRISRQSNQRACRAANQRQRQELGFVSNLPTLEEPGSGPEQVVMIANIYTAVGAIASQEAMLRIAPEARTGLVDMVTRVLKREVASPSFQQSGVIRPRAMKVIDPVICWFRLEHVTGK